MTLKNPNCIFCKIANHEIVSNVVYEDEMVIAFLDNNPTSKGHTLVITKDHYENFLQVPSVYLDHAFHVAQKISHSIITNLQADGVNILTNSGKAAGQVIEHFHIHIIPRYSGDTRKLLEFSPYQIENKEYLALVNSIKEGL